MNETETFQHYQVLKREDGSLWELGRGAMGVTYKAFDVNLRCHVALKVVNSQLLDSEIARARFLREARAAAGLRHRNVASVYHLGNDEESFFYSMEFIDGQTVEGLVGEQGPLPAVTALQIVRQVTRALGAAAKQGVVHRDIKPANLMVVHEDDEEDEEGFVVKVIDFGLARSAMAGGEQSGHITMGGFVGTPQYASPEQIEEKDLDVRSDIYSLGITLWYMLAGQPPFTGTVFRISSQHLSKEPPWQEIEAATPEPVRALLGRMLQKEPAQRPQTPAKLRAEIEECLRQLPSGGAAPLVVGAASASNSDTRVPEDSAASATIIQGPAPTAGRIFAGRYQLNSLAGEGASGQTFRAYDGRLDGKLVAVKVLHPELNLSPQAFYHLQGDLGRLRDAPHPQLIETFLLERVHGYKFVVMEWVNGYPLAELLGGAGALPLREALRLLGQAADAAAHCSAHRLHRLELSPQKILLHFPDVDEEADAPAPATLRGNNPEQGPRFCLKIDALAPAREAGRTSVRGSGGNAPRVAGRDTLTSIRGLVEGSYFYALGALLCELLGAAPPATGESQEIPALAELGEDGNTVLHKAFSTNPGFATENEFYHALLKACGLRREDMGLSRNFVEDPAPPPGRTAGRGVSAEAVTRVPSGARPTEVRPTPAAPPGLGRVPPPAPVRAPAKPAAPASPKADAQKTLARHEAATLVRPERIAPAPARPERTALAPTPAPAPVVARARALPVPPPPVVLPPPEAVAPPVQRAPAPPPRVEPPAPVVIPEPTAPAVALIEPTVLPEPSPPPAAVVEEEPAPPPVEDFAAAATVAPVQPMGAPPEAPPATPKVERSTRKRLPLVPLLATAAVLLIGGIVAALTMSKPPVPRPPVGPPATDKKISTPADGGPTPTATPAAPPAQDTNPSPFPTAAVSPSPLPIEMHPWAADTPPLVPDASPAQDAPVIMEVVPDLTPTPAATPGSEHPAAATGVEASQSPGAEVSTTPSAHPAVSPGKVPHDAGKAVDHAGNPKAGRFSPPPPKSSPTSKPRATSVKPSKPTPPPRASEDVPDFMR